MVGTRILDSLEQSAAGGKSGLEKTQRSKGEETGGEIILYTGGPVGLKVGGKVPRPGDVGKRSPLRMRG